MNVIGSRVSKVRSISFQTPRRRCYSSNTVWNISKSFNQSNVWKEGDLVWYSVKSTKWKLYLSIWVKTIWYTKSVLEILQKVHLNSLKNGTNPNSVDISQLHAESIENFGCNNYSDFGWSWKMSPEFGCVPFFNESRWNRQSFEWVSSKFVSKLEATMSWNFVSIWLWIIIRISKTDFVNQRFLLKSKIRIFSWMTRLVPKFKSNSVQQQ